MKISRGSSRVVIAFPFLKVAIKFPRFHLGEAWHILKSYWQRGLIRSLKKEKVWTTDHWGTLKMALGKGLRDNIEEFRCYYTHGRKCQFLMPTYFSLFGLMNIQKFGQPLKMETFPFWFQMVEIVGEDVWKNSHHFAESTNFSFQNGKLRILDYGSPRTNPVIIQYGDSIQTGFDINLDDRTCRQRLRDMQLVSAKQRLAKLKQEKL